MKNFLKRIIKGSGSLKNLVTLSELSDLTKIKKMTLYMAIRMGRLDATWDGHVWLSSVKAVEQAVREGKMQGVEE